MNEKRTLRSGPIVWGVVVLTFCAFVAQLIVSPAAVSPWAWITGLVLLVGLILLVVGVSVLVRQRK